MFADPARAKHAAKVALGIVIAYGLALQWDWTNPYWAGFAVLFCGLTSQGESLNKSIYRIVGTFVGMAAALLILIFFSQDRWLFIAAVCIYLGIASYNLTGGRRSYLWQTSGIVLLIILPTYGSESADIFYLAMARTQETVLGCCIWTLIGMFVFPVTNSGELSKVAAKLAGVQVKMFQFCRAQSMAISKEKPDMQPYGLLRGEQLKAITQLEALLKAAGAESYEVRENYADWQQLLDDSRALSQAYDGWALALDELSELDLEVVIPNINELLDAFEGVSNA
ncbi:MAG: FUSC family protein, partial [Gammaproteobacteria bacterium]